MKQLCAALLALVLAACGGGGDTSSNAGNSTSLGTTSSPEGGSSSSSSGSTGTAGDSSGDSGSAPEASSPDGVYRGQLTATLSGEGVLPVSDSTDLVIEISGSEVIASAEGRSYEGELDGNSFTVEIPIDEESRGITCQGTPVLEGRVSGGAASGSVSGSGQCYSETSVVPVEVTGEFSARK